MTKLEQAARQALEALEMYNEHGAILRPLETTNALREALAEQAECKECGAKQAQIDRLMLEYCPDEMTTEQMREWGNNQRPAEQAEQEPIRFVWNGEGWIEADEYIWKTTDDHERRILYATPQPDMNLNCKSVQKRLATVWGYVKTEQQEQEPYAYEVWDKNDQVLILIYASCLKEFHWIEQDDIARKLYASPVRTKDLTDDEIENITGHRKVGGTWPVAVLVGLSLVAADREKNK